MMDLNKLEALSKEGRISCWDDEIVAELIALVRRQEAELAEARATIQRMTAAAYDDAEKVDRLEEAAARASLPAAGAVLTDEQIDAIGYQYIPGPTTIASEVRRFARAILAAQPAAAAPDAQTDEYTPFERAFLSANSFHTRAEMTLEWDRGLSGVMFRAGVAAAQPEAKECTNSDSWNCKYCRKTDQCEAVKDPRNFGTPVKPSITLKLDRIVEARTIGYHSAQLIMKSEDEAKALCDAVNAAVGVVQPEAKAAPAQAESSWTAEEAADFAANPSSLEESRMSLAARVAGMAIRKSTPDEALMFQIKRLQSLLTKPHRELIERAIQWHEAGREAQEVRRLVPSQATDAAAPAMGEELPQELEKLAASIDASGIGTRSDAALIRRACMALRQPGAEKAGSLWTYDMTPPQGFIDYVKANYSGVVDFYSAEWHAKRLWNAAMRNARHAVTIAATAPVSQPAAQEPVNGDILPPVGSTVQIHLSRPDAWIDHTVTGYYAWPDRGGNPALSRVFVRVVDANGYDNARLLCDVRHPAAPQPLSAPAGSEQEKAAFETWMREHQAASDDTLKRPYEGRYFWPDVAGQWDAWEARAALSKQEQSK